MIMALSVRPLNSNISRVEQHSSVSLSTEYGRGRRARRGTGERQFW